MSGSAGTLRAFLTGGEIEERPSFVTTGKTPVVSVPQVAKEIRDKLELIATKEHELMLMKLHCGAKLDDVRVCLTTQHGREQGSFMFERLVGLAGVHRGTLEKLAAVAEVFADANGDLNKKAVGRYRELRGKARATLKTWSALEDAARWVRRFVMYEDISTRAQGAPDRGHKNG